MSERWGRMRIGIEQRDEKATILDPSEMRRRIFEASYESHLVRGVMNTADWNGVNAEDRYTMLAYHALVALETYYQKVSRMIELDPGAPLIEKYTCPVCRNPGYRSAKSVMDRCTDCFNNGRV